MNLAFPALCILLVVLPGIIYRKAYSQGGVPVGRPQFKPTGAPNKYPTSRRPLADEIALSLVAAIILHVVWLCVCSGIDGWREQFGFITGVKPDYEKLIRVLYGDLGADYGVTLDYVAKRRGHLAGYFLSLYAFAFLAAKGVLWEVRKRKWDHRFFLLRLRDDWFYLLRGEIFGFAEFRPYIQTQHEVVGTYISAVVNQGKHDYLYKGFLWDFYLDRYGNLDRLVIHNVIRCRFDPEEESGDGGTLAGGSSEGPPIQEGTRAPEPVEFPEPARAPANGERAGKKQSRIVTREWTFQQVSSQMMTIKYADCRTLAYTFFYIDDITDDVRKREGESAEPGEDSGGKGGAGGRRAPCCH